jgi:hypothetical protein
MGLRRYEWAAGNAVPPITPKTAKNPQNDGNVLGQSWMQAGRRMPASHASTAEMAWPPLADSWSGSVMPTPGFEHRHAPSNLDAGLCGRPKQLLHGLRRFPCPLDYGIVSVFKRIG